MNKDLKEIREQVLYTPMGRIFQAERRASARAELSPCLVCEKKSREVSVADEKQQ